MPEKFDPENLGPALLFCPGDRPERFAKAAAAADQVVLDLEDGVLPANKDTARAPIAAYLATAAANTVVRINHPATLRGIADAAAIIAAGCRVLLLPKTESAAEIDAVLAAHPDAAGVQLIVTIETARGVLALPEILARPEVCAVGWGPYDLAADIGARAVRDPSFRLLSPLLHARDLILLHAAATRTLALDTVTTELRDPALLADAATEAAQLGMRGKFAIHPSQIDIIRSAFCPSEAEVALCTRMLAAAGPHGAFLFEGEMIDEPMLRRARCTLEIHSKIKSKAQATGGSKQ